MADNSGLPPLEVVNTDPKTSQSEVQTEAPDLILAPSSKEVMIGAGALFVLAVIFFFIRNAYANYLVSSLKRSPNNAGLAGWFLFGGLLFASAIGSVALVSKSYLTALHVLPLVALSLICLIFCLVVSLKK